MAYTTIDDPEKYFKPVKYVGNLLQHPVEGFNHQPDWLWFKNADTTNSHNLLDSTRGTDKKIEGTNNNNAEADTTTRLDSFDSDGFTVETDPSVNGNNNEIVVFSWAANGGSTTTNDASATGVGSVDSVYQVNSTSKFGIMTYTATGSGNITVAHGMGSAPKFVITKVRDQAFNWVVGHHKVSSDFSSGLSLNSNGAAADNSDAFGDTAPSSTVFTMGNGGNANNNYQSGDDIIAYYFDEVKGFSKFHTYVGNGNANGPFVYTGFKPAWVMVKKSSGGSHDWYIQYGNTRFDGVSQAANPVKSSLIANSSGTKATENSMDFLSNGFKIRTSGNGHNTSGHTYLYVAFAQNPFVNSNGVPSNSH